MNTLFNNFIIFGAKYLLFLIIVIAFIWLFRLPRKVQKEVIVIGILTSIIALLIARIAAHFYFDPRPFAVSHVVPLLPHDPDNGFPSDHTLLAAVIAFVLLLYNKPLGTILLILALAVGLSRVFAQVHHTVDILASVLIAGAALLIAHKIIFPHVVKSKLYNKFFNQ